MLLRTPALDDVRDTFLSSGTLDRRMQEMVRPVVLESWKRSRLVGAYDRTARLPFESPIVSDSVLLRAARPVLSVLADELEMDHASLLIADRHAQILETWSPNRQFGRRMESIGSIAGHSGAEEVIGTNGIGTPTADRRASMIVGAEHLSQVLTDFACIGAPIKHPITNRHQGVVTLTALVRDASPILPGLINQAAREVGRQLLNLASTRERVLFDSFLSASRHGRPIAVVGGDILMENPPATEFLQHVEKATLWVMISEAIDVQHPKRTIRLESETSMTDLRCSAVIFDDEVIGAIVEIVNQTHLDSVIDHGRGVTHPGWAPLADTLPGTSPAWVYAREQAESSLRASLPTVVFGASGTGKYTLIRHMLERVAPGTSPLTFDALDSSSNEESWFAKVEAALNGPTPVILRHLDLVSERLAQVLAACLSGRPSLLERGLVHATAGAQGAHQLTEAHQSLLDTVGVGRIDMPNLRERKQDLRTILNALERKYAPSMTVTYTQGAFTALSRAPWPGNLRQLDSVMRGVFALGRRSEVTIDQLPPAIAAHARRRDLTMLEQLEVDGIVNALIRCDGNKVVAAEMLGISRSTLYRKISAYKLDDERLFL